MQIGETINVFKKGNSKYVTVFLAEGNTKDANGVGIADEYLDDFAKQWIGQYQTAIAFPTAGHPKYAPIPDEIKQSGNKIEAAIQWYRNQAKPYSIGKFVHTFIKRIKETGKRMLLGTFEIQDSRYKQLWEKQKFPKWNSTSILELDTNKEGFITKAEVVDNCSVNDPHYGTQRAGIYHVCDGGQECIAKSEQVLKQSGNGLMLCNLCSKSSVDLYTNFFDPSSIVNNPHIELRELLQSGESYLTEENNNSQTSTEQQNKGATSEGKILPDSTQTKIVESEEGKNEEKTEEGSGNEGSSLPLDSEKEKDWKAYAMQLESKIKSEKQSIKDNYVSKKDFEKLTQELRYNKVNQALKNLKEQLPDLFKDDKEFTDKVEYFNNLKMSDAEVLEHIKKTVEMYAPLIKENRKLKQSGNQTPYGIDVDEITSKLKSSGNSNDDDNKDKAILVGDW